MYSIVDIIFFVLIEIRLNCNRINEGLLILMTVSQPMEESQKARCVTLCRVSTRSRHDVANRTVLVCAYQQTENLSANLHETLYRGVSLKFVAKFKFSAEWNKMTDTLPKDLHAILRACRAKLAKYLSERKVFRRNVVEKNEVHFIL
jgi:hypothetical protein